MSLVVASMADRPSQGGAAVAAASDGGLSVKEAAAALDRARARARAEIVDGSYMHFDDTYRLGRVTARATVGTMEAQEILIPSGCYVGFLPEHRGRLWQALGRMRAVKPSAWSLISRFHASHAGRPDGAALRSSFVKEL